MTALSRKELALALLASVLVAAALFGPQVANGGFVWDDWQNSANVHFASEPGFLGALDRSTARPVFGYRPVLTTLIVVEHWVLGSDQHLHLAMAALFGALTAWALYLLLRTAGLGRLESAVPAVLLLAFPWTDSTRLWATASYDTLAVALYLFGLTLGLRALRAGPGRRRVLLNAGSLALYLAAAWTYEILTMAALASVAVYLAVAPRWDALRRFALDAALVTIALVVVATGTTRDPQSLADQADHAGVIASQAFSLLARALLPVGAEVPGWVAGLVLAAAVAVGARRRDRWLVAAGIGALFVAAGYVLFVPALPHYQPLAPGTTNRMNVLAAAGYAVLVYALARILVRNAAAAAVVCALIGVGYVVQVARDQDGWQRSAFVQARVLGAIRERPPAGTTLYTFGAPTFVADGVPSFSLPFDLKAAVRLKFDDASLAAYPVAIDTTIVCGPNGLHPVGGTYGTVHGARYGAALFVDVPGAREIGIGSRRACRAWRTRLGAAPGTR